MDNKDDEIFDQSIIDKFYSTILAISKMSNLLKMRFTKILIDICSSAIENGWESPNTRSIIISFYFLQNFASKVEDFIRNKIDSYEDSTDSKTNKVKKTNNTKRKPSQDVDDNVLNENVKVWNVYRLSILALYERLLKFSGALAPSSLFQENFLSGC
jgi:hypothetical protein